MYLPDFIKNVDAMTVSQLIVYLKAMNPTDRVAICEIVNINKIVKAVEKDWDTDRLDVVGLAEKVADEIATRRYDYLNDADADYGYEYSSDSTWEETLNEYIDTEIDGGDFIDDEEEDEN